MPETTLAEVVAIMEGLYPPSLAASWDAVGLVCGDPAQPVNRVLFAVDPVEVVVDEALELGADLLVTHHPLFLHGTSSVAATTAKGRSVHRLIRAGIALHVAHTNADHANPGVSDALAGALGLVDTRPLSRCLLRRSTRLSRSSPRPTRRSCSTHSRRLARARSVTTPAAPGPRSVPARSCRSLVRARRSALSAR